MKFNEEEMLQFAQKLGRKLEPQDVIVLTGELGAGKTTFTKGLALGLEIHQMVKSPTYTIVRSLEGRLPLHHMDVYRIGDDPDSFDLDDYLFGDGVSVIEWGEMLGDDLPKIIWKSFLISILKIWSTIKSVKLFETTWKKI